MKNQRKKALSSRLAQSIIELAIFGAVLFFVITGIATNFLSGSFQQNAQLQAMRIALSRSYLSSESDTASRVQASYVFFEDRLNGDFGRYGFLDRQPVMVTGSGMLNKNAMLPVDWKEDQNLPMIDMKINGQEFHMSTGAFVKYKMLLKQSALTAPPATMAAANPDDLMILLLPSDGSGDSMCSGGAGVVNINSDNNKLARKRLIYEWTHYGTATATGTTPPFYTAIVANNTDFNAYDVRRLDLDRNGIYTDNMTTAGDPTWQWTWKTLKEVADSIDTDNGSYPSYDINGDRTEETVYELTWTGIACAGYVAYTVAAIDTTAGDLDSNTTAADFAATDEHKPGIRPNMRIYSQTQCVPTATATCAAGEVTYFDVREGKNFSLGGQPLNVSTIRKNQNDVIEREYQLNWNMMNPGAFVSRNPVAVEVSCGAAATGVSCCMDTAMIQRTCFDTAKKTLFIRSRISDKRGRKWVTAMDEPWNESTSAP